MSTGPDRIDELAAEVQERVERRQADGGYSPDLEADLESRFASLRRAAEARRSFDPFESAMDHQRTAGHFARDRIEVESSVPGGGAVHRAAGLAVRRQVDGLLDQMQQFSDAVNATSELLGSMLADPPFHHHDDLRADLDMIDDRLTHLERARAEIDSLGQRVHDMERHVRSMAAVGPDLDWGRFARRFRGDEDELLGRYADVADLYLGLSPVLDIGCGDGNLLTLLADREVECWGIEIDPALADAATSAGHLVRVADGIEVLANLGDASLGGIALIQVVEHLAPASLPGLVAEASRVLKPGGVLYMETPNPESLYVHSHGLWLDPSHSRPVHPLYLEFLCQSSRFSTIEIRHASPVPEDEALPAVPDDGSALAATLATIVERLNPVVFGPQDYAVVATR